MSESSRLRLRRRDIRTKVESFKKERLLKRNFANVSRVCNDCGCLTSFEERKKKKKIKRWESSREKVRTEHFRLIFSVVFQIVKPHGNIQTREFTFICCLLCRLFECRLKGTIYEVARNLKIRKFQYVRGLG